MKEQKDRDNIFKQAEDLKTDIFRDAEALSKIKALPTAKEMSAPVVHRQEIIDDPGEFQSAVGRCQMTMHEDGKDYIEVSERVYKYLLKNNISRYITYGDPGVKIYLAGTKEENDDIDRMSAEAYHNYLGQKKRNGNR